MTRIEIMMNEETLKAIHNALCTDLLHKIQSGEASSADLSVARQFLKDNGIDCAAGEGTPLHNLALSLPFDEDGNRKLQPSAG